MGTSGEATALADVYLLLRESKPSASVALACLPRFSPAAGYRVLFKHMCDQNRFGDHCSVVQCQHMREPHAPFIVK